jgi:predicted amidohydrolase
MRESGHQIRSLMREARASGAILAQFPEGAVVYPGKRVMSSGGPSILAEADWSRANWDVIRGEAESIASLAAELELWTAFGSPHPLTPPRRPHNSLYIVSPSGAVVTRYDKRFLSNTEVSWMYTPGTEPVVFEAEGLRFGCALCIEAHFPEIFAEYEQLNVDCMLLSVMVDDPVRPVIAQAYAALYDYWVGYSAPAQFSRSAPAGIVGPGGNWITRCSANGQPGIAVADLDPHGDSDIDIALQHARPWRRTARTGLYDSRQAPEDLRSLSRTSF